MVANKQTLYLAEIHVKKAAKLLFLFTRQVQSSPLISGPLCLIENDSNIK